MTRTIAAFLLVFLSGCVVGGGPDGSPCVKCAGAATSSDTPPALTTAPSEVTPTGSTTPENPAQIVAFALYTNPGVRGYLLDTSGRIGSASVEIDCSDCAAPLEQHVLDGDYNEWEIYLDVSDPPTYVSGVSSTWGGWPHETDYGAPLEFPATVVIRSQKADYEDCWAFGLDAQDYVDECSFVATFEDYTDSPFYAASHP